MNTIYFFFFSSRRRHTRFSRDWSSDVCSSDLSPSPTPWGGSSRRTRRGRTSSGGRVASGSEERRVGKECRSRWSPYHLKKKMARRVGIGLKRDERQAKQCDQYRHDTCTIYGVLRALKIEKRLRLFFFFQAEDGIRDFHVTGVQTCALPI